MLGSVRVFFQEHLLVSTSSVSDSEERRLRLATVALLVEMMNADDAVDAEEMKTLHRLIRERYLLNDSEASELIELAGQKADEAIDLYQFTRLINQHYSQVQKIRLVEELWRLSVADKYVDRYEEHFVRKIAELIYVPHGDYIGAKLRARQPESP